jgi:hypothetical protein
MPEIKDQTLLDLATAEKRLVELKDALKAKKKTVAEMIVSPHFNADNVINYSESIHGAEFAITECGTVIDSLKKALK